MHLTLSEGLTIVPGYRLVQFLGKGGFGEVWRASGPGRVPVALKVIELKGSKTGEREFRSLDLLRDLRHPNLLPLQGYWLLDDKGQVIEDDRPATTLVIAMLLGGKSLRQRLDECRKLNPGIPPAELISYMHDAAKGIDFLNSPRHQLGEQVVAIQHRDIKPENLLVVGDGVMVADFGIARVMEQSSSSLRTETAAMTIWYAAPELFDFKATSWTDQYALAITYCELRTGRLPFPDDCTPTKAMMVHLKGGHVFDGLTANETEVLRRATSIVPEQRYPHCLELVADLDAALRLDSGSGAVPAVAMRVGTGTVSRLSRPVMATQAYTSEVTDPAADGLATEQVGPSPGVSHSTATPTAAIHADGTVPQHAPAAMAKLAATSALTRPASANATTRAPSVAPAVTPSRRTPIVAAASLIVLLPIGWFAVKQLLRDKADQQASSTMSGVAADKTPTVHPTNQQPATDPVLAAREKAALALVEERFGDVVALLDPLAREQKATPSDHTAIARARLGLAENGADPAANLRRAAESFALANDKHQQTATLTKLAAWCRANDRLDDAISALVESNKVERGHDSLLELCDLYLERGRPDSARDTAESLIHALADAGKQDGPLAARAHRHAAQALERLGVQTESADAPDRAKLEEIDQKAESHYQTAAEAAKRLDMKEAATWQADLTAFRALPRVAKRMEAKQLQRAIAQARKELAESPMSHAVLIKLAELEDRVGDAKQAAAHFVEGFSRQAIELASSGKLDDAAASIERAAERDAEHVLVQLAQGIITSQKGDAIAAIRSFDSSLGRAAADDPDRWKIRAERGIAYTHKAAASKGSVDDWRQALSDLDAAIKDFPAPPEPAPDKDAVTTKHRELAAITFARGAAIEGLAAAEPSRPDPQRTADAEQAFLRAVALNPGEPRYRASAVRSLLNHGRGATAAAADQAYADAQRHLAEWIALDPKSAEAFSMQGDLLLIEGKTVAARAAFDKAVEFGAGSPDDRRYVYSVQQAHAYLREPVDFARALAAADRAVAINQNDPAGHYSRGLALRGQNKMTDALAAFDAAIAHNPKHSGALVAKSQIVIEREGATAAEIERAHKDIEAGLKSATTDEQKAEAYYVRSLAWLKNHLANAGNPALAESALLECLRDLLSAVRLVPANAVYTAAAD